jgi:DeoR family transcriptional regulator, fructose operon transcriptional repressor
VQIFAMYRHQTYMPGAIPQTEFGFLWHSQRRMKILSILKAEANARTSEIARQLGVSRETVRRDLKSLENEGLLDRVHGGAVMTEHESEASFDKRRRLNWGEKLEIGRKAMDLLSPGMSVFLDAGTTTLAFAEQLRSGPEVTVITNSLSAAELLGADALLLGGRILSDVPACFGELTLSQIERFRADLAIISPTAVHAETGVTYYELHESEIARAMAGRAARTVVLADSSKIGATSRVVMAELSTVDHLITSDGLNRDLHAQFQNALRRPLV